VFVAGGVDLATVEAAALVGIRQQLVRACDDLEPGFRLGVSGVQIGMVALGELAVGPADGGLVGVTRDSQGDVGIGSIGGGDGSSPRSS
jgi:hypothetical protein